MMTENSSLLQPRAKQTNNRLFCFNLTTGETRRSKLEGLFKDDDKANSSVKICVFLLKICHSQLNLIFSDTTREKIVERTDRHCGCDGVAVKIIGR